MPSPFPVSENSTEPENPVLNSGFYDEFEETPLVEFEVGSVGLTPEEDISELTQMIGITGGDSE